MPPIFFSAAYMGLIAAPGTPNAVSTPSRRITSTAASIALILAIVLFLVLILIVYKSWNDSRQRERKVKMGCIRLKKPLKSIFHNKNN